MIAGTRRRLIEEQMHAYRDRIRSLIHDTGALIHTDEPMQLASGELSCDFIDGKLAVAHAEGFALVGDAMNAAARDRGIGFDAVGGLVLGSVPFTFAVAVAARCDWFMIRREPKGRGTNRWVEGARIGPGSRVLLVDDVVTTGGSIQDAYHRVAAEGAEVVFATTLVDRSDVARRFFDELGVPYEPMLTYEDLAIPPVGQGSGTAATG